MSNMEAVNVIKDGNEDLTNKKLAGRIDIPYNCGGANNYITNYTNVYVYLKDFKINDKSTIVLSQSVVASGSPAGGTAQTQVYIKRKSSNSETLVLNPGANNTTLTAALNGYILPGGKHDIEYIRIYALAGGAATGWQVFSVSGTLSINGSQETAPHTTTNQTRNLYY